MSITKKRKPCFMPSPEIANQKIVDEIKTRIAGLDYLRGLAILLVLLYHCTPNKNPDLGVSSLLFKIAGFGWLGVDLFFVLSGYLVCKMLLEIKQSGRSLSLFFRNRLLRIVPIYYLSLVVILVIYPILTDTEIPSLKDSYPYWLYLSNNIGGMDSSFYQASIKLGHFWSLALEMQFYLLFPVLVRWVSRDKLITLLIAIWLIVIALRCYAVFTGVSPEVTYFYSPFRCDGLLLGALVAASGDTLKRQGMFSSLAFLSACYLCWMVWLSQGGAIFKVEPSFYIHRVLLPVAISLVSAYALLLALQKKQSNHPQRFSILTFLAKYSYGIYVYHFIFKERLEQWLVPWFSSFLQSQNHIVASFFVSQLCLFSAVAWISFHFFEKHFLARKKH